MSASGEVLSVPVQRSVVLVGFMAAGKSKIGRQLAERLGLAFVDVDAAIEQEYGCSISDLFRDRGEPQFRKAERSHILRLVAGQPHVVAVGGGAFADDQNRELLNRSSRTVWLDTPFELILARLRRSTGRPLAINRSESELRALWDERQDAYRTAEIRIDTSDADVDRIIERIIAALG